MAANLELDTKYGRMHLLWNEENVILEFLPVRNEPAGLDYISSFGWFHAYRALPSTCLVTP